MKYKQKKYKKYTKKAKLIVLRQKVSAANRRSYTDLVTNRWRQKVLIFNMATRFYYVIFLHLAEEDLLLLLHQKYHVA